MNMLLELIHFRLSGTSLDDGAPYSRTGFHELKLLLPDLETNWNGKLSALPKELAGRTHWQYDSGNHASDSRRMLRSVNITAILDDGTNVNIIHVVIEGSSQWIVGRNVTTKCDVIHTNGKYLKLPDDSRIPLQTVEFHSYMPHETFSKKEGCSSLNAKLFCATFNLNDTENQTPIQIQSNQDGELIQEVKKEMVKETSKAKTGSLHTTMNSGLADASGETNLTMQTAVIGNITLHEETGVVVSKTSPAFEYTVSERAIKEEIVDTVGANPQVNIVPNFQGVVKRETSSVFSGDRPVTKSDMKELIAEFRKEVDLTMREHVDGLHRELIEATSRVENNFVSKSSFEILQDEVGKLRAQVEGMAHVQGNRVKGTAFAGVNRKKTGDVKGCSSHHNGDRVTTLHMGPSLPDTAAVIPFSDVRFRALLDYRLYHLSE